MNAINNATKRTTVPAIDEILEHEFPVLDHGFVRVIDYMGDDQAILQAARVSYGRGTRQVNADRGLINYLMRHSHTTPFEMCEIKFHIKCPIFIARQWMRHRAASINEYSARYSILDREFYLPSPQNIAPQSAQNKQCREDANQLSPAAAEAVRTLLRDDASRCYDSYMHLLNLNEDDTVADPTRPGIARELARINLNLSYYTQWYWKINLHNLLHFLQLRSHKHAQYEIRAYADIILDIVAKWVPYTYDAFCNYKLHGASLSQRALEVVRNLLNSVPVSFADSGLSRREWDDLCSILGRDPESDSQTRQ